MKNINKLIGMFFLIALMPFMSANLNYTVLNDSFHNFATIYNSEGVYNNGSLIIGNVNGSLDDVMLFNGAVSIAEGYNIYNSNFSRFYPIGEMNFTGNNFGTNNTVNITIPNCEQYNGSLINFKVNGGSYSQLNSSCMFDNYNMTGDLTSASVVLQLNSTNNYFYSPVINGNITLNSWLKTTSIPAPIYPGSYSWVSNNTLNKSLPDIGIYSAPTVFSKDSFLYLISGDGFGQFSGFAWNGTDWNSNDTIINGLPDLGDNSAPVVFSKDSSLYLISGANDGKFYGYVWNTDQWVTNLTINYSLPDIGSDSKPTVFNISINFYMIAGNTLGEARGFFFNGTDWLSNSTINASLNDGWGEFAPNVFNREGNTYLISGSRSDGFHGYSLSGSQWLSKSILTNGLPSFGINNYTTPCVFQRGNDWYLISGNQDGNLYEFASNLENISPTYSTEMGDPNKGIFFIDVNDNSVLEPSGQYIFSTNESGDWVNETTGNFKKTPMKVWVSKSYNYSFQRYIAYRWYISDTTGNVNSTPIYTATLGNFSDLNTATVYLNLTGKQYGFNLIYKEDYSGAHDDFGGIVTEDGIGYSVSKNDSGYIHSFNSTTGTSKWSTYIGESDGTPLIDNQGGFLYINIYNASTLSNSSLNGIYKINKTNGTIMLEEHSCSAGSTQSIIQSNDSVYMGCGDGNIYGYWKVNLTVRWSYENSGGAACAVRSTPIYYNDTVTYGLYGCADDFAQVNATTGTKIWGNPYFNNVWDMQPSIKDGIIYMGSYYSTVGNSGIGAFNFTTGILNIWNRTDINGTLTQFAIYNNKLWIGGNISKLYSLFLNNGSTSCTYTVGGNIYQGPSISNGIVFFGSLDNYVYAINSSDCSLIWKYDTGDDIFNPPAISKGDLFIKNDNFSLYKFNIGTGTEDWKYIGYNSSGQSYCENCLNAVQGVIINCSASDAQNTTCSVNNSYSSQINTTIISPVNVTWCDNSGTLLNGNSTNISINLDSLSYQNIKLSLGQCNYTTITSLINLLYPPSSPWITPNSTQLISYGITLNAGETLNNITMSWNGTNTTLIDSSLLGYCNMENNSAIEENDTKIVCWSTNGGFNGTVSGGAISNGTVKYGKSYWFDGVNDKIITKSGLIASASNLTICMWAYRQGNGGGGYGRLVDDVNYKIHYDVDFNTLVVNNLGSSLNANAGFFPTNEWIHICVTTNSTGYTNIYKNGAFNKAGNTHAIEGGDVFNIGNRAGNDRGFNGSIDDVKIWNRSLSANEVYQDYLSQITKYNSTYYQYNTTQNTSYLSTPSFLCSSNLTNVFCSNTENTRSVNTISANFSNSIGIINNDFHGISTYAGYMDDGLEQTSAFANSKIGSVRMDMDLQTLYSNTSASSGVNFTGNITPYLYEVQYQAGLGNTVIFIIDYMPNFLADNTTGNCDNLDTCIPNNYTKFNNIVLDFINRVTQSGLYTSTLELEFWNEPDLVQFFLGNVAESNFTRYNVYNNFYNKTYQGVHSVYPNIPFFGAGLSSLSSDAKQFLASFYSYNGNISDGMSIHFYWNEPDAVTYYELLDTKLSWITTNCSGYNLNDCSKIRITEGNVWNATIKNTSAYSNVYSSEIALAKLYLLNKYPDNSSFYFFRWSIHSNYTSGQKFSAFYDSLYSGTGSPIYTPLYNTTKDFAHVLPSGCDMKKSSIDNSNVKIASCNVGSFYGMAIINSGTDEVNETWNGSLVNGTCGFPYNNLTNYTGGNLINVTNCQASIGIMNPNDIVYLNASYGGVANSCTYTSGNWNILSSDYCNITSNVVASAGVNNVTIIGIGTTTITANITGFKNVLTSGGAGICTVNCIGGCFK